jgi:hypothetical protein
MIEQTEKIEFENEVFLMLEGKITELQIAKSSQNLLEQIDKKIKSESLAIGTLAALSDMHGVLANSLSLSLYDGEEIFNFAGIVQGQVVFGAFSKADKIKNEDIVRVVASKRGDVLYVHSLLKTNNDLLLLPLMVFSGDRAFFRSCMKSAWRYCILIWAFLLFRFILRWIQNFTPQIKCILLRY